MGQVGSQMSVIIPAHNRASRLTRTGLRVGATCGPWMFMDLGVRAAIEHRLARAIGKRNYSKGSSTLWAAETAKSR